MQDKQLEEYKNPFLRNKEYLEFCDKKVNSNFTENKTYSINNKDHTDCFDFEMRNPLNSIRSSFIDDFNNNIYNNF